MTDALAEPSIVGTLCCVNDNGCSQQTDNKRTRAPMSKPLRTKPDLGLHEDSETVCVRILLVTHLPFDHAVESSVCRVQLFMHLRVAHAGCLQTSGSLWQHRTLSFSRNLKATYQQGETRKLWHMGK